MLRDTVLAALVVAAALAVSLGFPDFTSPAGLAEIVNDTSLLVILALGQALVLITRAVDLSVAANVALSGMMAALLNVAHPELGVGACLLAALFTGAALGAINGLLVWRLKDPPIVATLATMSVFRGAAFFATGGEWVNSSEMSAEFLEFQRSAFLGLTTSSWLSFLTMAAIALLLGWTRLGRTIFMAGSNPDAAIYVGVRPERAQFFAYLICGALAGLVGYFWVSRFGVAYAETAIGFELQVIAACVIGGVAINGGVGTVSGVVAGAAFLGVIKNALPLLNVSPFWQMAISGVVILVAVSANALMSRPAKRRIMEART